jgi:aryl-alcohol dehydrogenase-like predicted oxidoreductase
MGMSESYAGGAIKGRRDRVSLATKFGILRDPKNPALRGVSGSPRFQSEDIVPIPGTKRRQYLEENVAALDFVLEPAHLRSLGEVFELDAAAGDRYPPAGMGTLDR